MVSQAETLDSPIKSFNEVFEKTAIDNRDIEKENGFASIYRSKDWHILKDYILERIKNWTDVGFENNEADTIEMYAINTARGQSVVTELRSLIYVIESAEGVISNAEKKENS